MEAEQVVGKILAEAKAEAEKIKAEAEAKTAAERAELESQLGEYRKESKVLAESKAEDKKQRLLAKARMAIVKESLVTKKSLLDEVFATAQQQIKNLPDDKYLELMGRLMIKAAETGDEEVIVGAGEKRIDQAFIDKINRQVGSEAKANLKLSDDKADIGSGFILRRGKIRMNVSGQVLVANARQELDIELARELFEGSQ